MSTKRTFTIGDEWIYFKFYCGPQTSDKLLLDLLPAIEALKAGNYIDKWFFIRYNDPHNHLRVRFHLTESMQFHFVINEVNQILNYYSANDLVWKIQLDSYNREMERYGTLVELSEELFCHDSQSTIEMLSLIDEIEDSEEIRWLFCMKSIDQILDDFSYTFENKIALIRALKDAFYTEFGVEKPFKTLLANKFRNKRKIIDLFFDNIAANQDQPNDYHELYGILQKRSASHKIINDKKASLEQNEHTIQRLMPSYTHMLCNRIFRTKQRAHEMVIYDLLHQYYSAKKGKLKSQENSSY